MNLNLYRNDLKAQHPQKRVPRRSFGLNEHRTIGNSAFDLRAGTGEVTPFTMELDIEIPTLHPTEANRRSSPAPGDPPNVPRATEDRAAPSAVSPLKSGINAKTQVIPGEARLISKPSPSATTTIGSPSRLSIASSSILSSVPTGSCDGYPAWKPNSGSITSRMPAPPPSINWTKMLPLAIPTAATTGASPASSDASIPRSAPTGHSPTCRLHVRVDHLRVAHDPLEPWRGTSNDRGFSST